MFCTSWLCCRIHFICQPLLGSFFPPFLTFLLKTGQRLGQGLDLECPPKASSSWGGDFGRWLDQGCSTHQWTFHYGVHSRMCCQELVWLEEVSGLSLCSARHSLISYFLPDMREAACHCALPSCCFCLGTSQPRTESPKGTTQIKLLLL